ncbi:Uncharacterised protein [Mycobacteroides abscessus]|nr:Uncharacterised protein [Mycobacteroides abscessus]
MMPLACSIAARDCAHRPICSFACTRAPTPTTLVTSSTTPRATGTPVGSVQATSTSTTTARSLPRASWMTCTWTGASPDTARAMAVSVCCRSLPVARWCHRSSSVVGTTSPGA